MHKRLLLRSRESTVDRWIKESYPHNLILSLDPNPHRHGVPTTIGIRKESDFLYTAFIGTLNPLHNPMLFLESMIRLSQKISEDYIIEFPFWQNQYLYHQMLKTTCEVIQPTEIYIDEKIRLPSNLSYLNVQKISFDEGPTDTFLKTKRRSFWSQFFNEATLLEIHLNEVYLEGSRIGSGQYLNPLQFNPSVVYAEILGTKLFVITQNPLTYDQQKKILDQAGALRIIEIPVSNYSGLVCNVLEKYLLNVDLSVIQKIDFSTRTIYLLVLEPFPSHLKYIQLGILRLNNVGKELEDRSSLSL